MWKDLQEILEIQELDMQMIQLMLLKKQRRHELDNIIAVKMDLRTQVNDKQNDIKELKIACSLMEGEISDITAKLKKLENMQGSIKKVEEFNALSQEMAQADREKHAKEQRLSDILDRIALEEDALKNIEEALNSTVDNSKSLELEIHDSVNRINEEGKVLKAQRDELVKKADQEIFHVYERLLKNKKDRVVVPIENRCCSGCHIMLTAQDENLVRKGERLLFCEHCSRIHYWQDRQVVEGDAVATKTRRRRVPKAV